MTQQRHYPDLEVKAAPGPAEVDVAAPSNEGDEDPVVTPPPLLLLPLPPLQVETAATAEAAAEVISWTGHPEELVHCDPPVESKNMARVSR